MRILVAYYSRGGTTKSVAELIGEEVNKAGGTAEVRSVSELKPEDLVEYKGIIVGSPTYYGSMAGRIKEMFDKSVSFHGKLDNKIGGAFATSANIGGGNETTLLSILEAMLIHGMIIQGDFNGDHYGPVAVGGIDRRCRDNCSRFARRFVALLGGIKG